MSLPLRASRSVVDLVLDVRPVLRRDLVAQVAQRPLGLEREGVRLVARLDLVAPLGVLLGVRLGVADHLVHVVLGEHRGRGDAHLLLAGWSPGPWPRTSRMPLASMSKVTSIWGTPRGAGGMPSRMNLPSVLLSVAISRSPCSTWISTCGWLSDAVEKTWLLLVGMVVLRSMSRVITPPRVSMPSDSGVTSSSRTSLTSPASTPAWMAAPTATTSSGLTPLCGSLPPNIALTASMTAGMRVWPPTRMTSSMSDGLRPASLRAASTGAAWCARPGPRPGPRAWPG